MNWVSIPLDNGLAPGRRQAIIWTNARMSLIGPLGTNFNEILIKILNFSFMKMHLKMWSVKWRPFCLSLNELRDNPPTAVTLASSLLVRRLVEHHQYWWSLGDYHMWDGCSGLHSGWWRGDLDNTGLDIDTLRPRQNGRHFADNIFRCILLNENVWILLTNHWSLLLMFQHWFR